MIFDLNYSSRGQGRAFVFQHGLGAQLAQPQGLLDGLENVRLLSMDCPGHGQSMLPETYVPSFENYADDVIRMLDHLQIEKAIFGGISMGAGISLNIALRFPDRVEALVLVRPAWLDRGFPENLMILLDLAACLPDERERFETQEVYLQINKSLPNAARSIMGQFTRDQGEHTGFVLSQMVKDAPFGHLDQLRNLDKPCLIIANEDDPLHPFEMAEKIGHYLAQSQLEKVTSRYVDDAAHRTQVRKLVSNFILKL